MAVTLLALCAGTASAEENNAEFLGKPFPDFTATDTEGNTFTLSGALKDHEAALINFWATWCVPCQVEFPYLNEAYEEYRDRVAFIALSTDKKDTPEMIMDFRAKNGIAFPMGSDGDIGLHSHIQGEGIPTTVIVDRFGNAVFLHRGTFISAKDVKLILDAFLGDGYTETVVYDTIPKDSSTRVFPVSAERALYPESGSCRKVLLTYEGLGRYVTGYIVPDDSFRMRIEIAADDDIASMTYVDMVAFKAVDVTDLLDPERGVYVYDQHMPDLSEEMQYTKVEMGDRSVDEDPNEMDLFLFRNEEAISQLSEFMQEEGYPEVTWTYAEEDERPENALQAYILHVVNQDSNPVREVYVNFCTDTACVPKESDEDGTITFTGEPDVYHVQIIDAPEGYSWDEDYEMYTTREYGEWVLRIRKDIP